MNLEFHILPTPGAQVWAFCLAAARAQGFRENDRFKNFPGAPDGSLTDLIEKLEHILEKLRTLAPHLDFPKVDSGHLQESINYLHYHFASRTDLPIQQ
jgi:hypothetical protein